MFPHDYFMTRSRWINDVLLSIREWRARRTCGEPFVQVPETAGDQLTVLVGNLSGGGEALKLSASLAGKISVQSLGFRFDGSSEVGQVTEFTGCRFPEFHGVLVSALMKISGRSLVVASPGLLGLGLGLLANFHFGTPVYYAGRGSGNDGEKIAVDFADPDYLDPASQAWEKLLSRWLDQVPRLEAGQIPPTGEIGVLPAATQFAEQFAGFYRGSRK